MNCEYQNISSDLMRALTIRSKCWPEMYWHQIPMFDHKQQTDALEWLPFLLPHEVIASLLKKNSCSVLACEARWDQSVLDHVAAVRRDIPGFKEVDIAAIGQWWDAVPVNLGQK